VLSSICHLLADGFLEYGSYVTPPNPSGVLDPSPRNCGLARTGRDVDKAGGGDSKDMTYRV
jgi:hypothetical protein